MQNGVLTTNNAGIVSEYGLLFGLEYDLGL
jgi:hypothetical protein